MNQASGTNEFQGKITDGATATGLTKVGGGTLILNEAYGSSAYSGPVTVNGGVLQAGDGASLGNTSSVTVASGATIRLDGNSVDVGSLSGAGTIENGGLMTYIMNEEFSSGTVTKNDSRFREGDINDGWHSRTDSQWTKTGVRMENSATNSGTVYEACPAESPVVKVVSNPAGGPTLTLSFDYSVAAGDTLYVHLWGYAGTLTNDNDMMGNTDYCDGAYGNIDASTELDAFNLKDGTTTFGGVVGDTLTSVTNSGTYSNTITIADLGMAGVNSLADFSHISLAFGKNEDGLPGTTWVDNVKLFPSVEAAMSTG